MRWFLVPLVLLGSISIAIAAAGLHGSGAVGCALRPGFADGCSGAPTANTFTVQHTNFFTAYAPQSGQTYTTRPPWNVAGVDYPVGINPLTLPGGVTPSTLKDPSSATLPTGCSYSAGSQTVTCGTATNPTLNGFDFGLHSGINLVMNNTANGTATIENCHFKWGTGSGVGVKFFMITIGGNITQLNFINNYVDGNQPNWAGTYPNGANSDLLYTPSGRNGAALVQYNVFVGGPSRWMSHTALGGLIWQYNYAEGLNYPIANVTASIDNGSGTGSPAGTVMTITSVANGAVASGSGMYGVGVNASPTPVTITSLGTGTGGTGTYNVGTSLAVAPEAMVAGSGSHGDGQLISANAGDTMALFQTSYSTALFPFNATGATALVTPTQSSSFSYTLWQTDHNTLVGNYQTFNGSPTGTMTAAVGQGGSSISFGTVIWDTNYLDPTGSFFCFVLGSTNTAGTLTQTGNINLTDSSTITDQTNTTCHNHI